MIALSLIITAVPLEAGVSRARDTSPRLARIMHVPRDQSATRIHIHGASLINVNAR